MLYIILFKPSHPVVVSTLHLQYEAELKASAETNAALIKALTEKMTAVFLGQKTQIESLVWSLYSSIRFSKVYVKMRGRRFPLFVWV